MCKLPVPDNIDKTIAFNPDYPVIRFAEIYYMLAECKYRSGYKKEAANLFNEVRKRNFENKADPDPVTETNIDKYRILDEWMVEFLGEQRRRTDLRRWGCIQQVLGGIINLLTTIIMSFFLFRKSQFLSAMS